MPDEATNKSGTGAGAESRDPVARAMGEWLSQWQWDAWCTLTFRDGNFSPDAADRAFAKLAQTLRVESAPTLSYFVGHELGGHTGRLHLHCLLGGLPYGDSRRGIWKWWHHRYGRAQVLPFDADRGAAFYVSKYVTKGLAHWDLELQGQTEQRTLTLFDQCAATRPKILRPNPCGKRTTSKAERRD